jgi:hypothetical protein
MLSNLRDTRRCVPLGEILPPGEEARLRCNILIRPLRKANRFVGLALVLEVQLMMMGTLDCGRLRHPRESKKYPEAKYT